MKENKATREWDTYYYKVCNAVASKSPCKSRQLGAILVKENIIIATGFNGPPRNFPHCHKCRRRALENYKSGEDLLICPATHAEANCIAAAARIGASVSGSTLYLNTCVPCKDCTALLINAGISEIVVESLSPYHELSIDMINHTNIILRKFRL